mmetsp:Transcript_17533/g.53461  ORF Transcript_17533/g.53461 Transcript_17533/m.53461 type:complete len:222 (-) Transcript_17533:115-780(-)
MLMMMRRRKKTPLVVAGLTAATTIVMEKKKALRGTLLLLVGRRGHANIRLGLAGFELDGDVEGQTEAEEQEGKSMSAREGLGEEDEGQDEGDDLAGGGGEDAGDAAEGLDDAQVAAEAAVRCEGLRRQPREGVGGGRDVGGKRPELARARDERRDDEEAAEVRQDDHLGTGNRELPQQTVLQIGNHRVRTDCDGQQKAAPGVGVCFFARVRETERGESGAE